MKKYKFELLYKIIRRYRDGFGRRVVVGFLLLFVIFGYVFSFRVRFLVLSVDAEGESLFGGRVLFGGDVVFVYVR